MSRRSLQVVALAAGIVGLASWSPVSARPLATPQGHAPGILASLWGDLASLWGATGCSLDPNGKCVSNPGGSAPARPGAGASRPVALRGATGCSIDPNGRCVQDPAAGTGSGLAGAPILGGGTSGPHRR